MRHGAKVKIKRCSSDGCINRVIKGGVCTKHGAKKKLCSSDGCTNQVKRRGVCCRHGAFRNPRLQLFPLIILPQLLPTKGEVEVEVLPVSLFAKLSTTLKSRCFFHRNKKLRLERKITALVLFYVSTLIDMNMNVTLLSFATYDS